MKCYASFIIPGLVSLYVVSKKDVKFQFMHFLQIGILGSSEGSKKAFTSALLRLIEPTGVVRIDGLNIIDVDLSDLRSKIVVVPQVRRVTKTFSYEKHSNSQIVSFKKENSCNHRCSSFSEINFVNLANLAKMFTF